MRRLLLVSHRPIDQAGGPAARWRSFARHLPGLGWEVDVVSAPHRESADEFGSAERAELRAKAMGALGRIADPAFRVAGLRPEALPLSYAWVPRGAARIRRRLRQRRYDAVLATGPPFAALVAARLAARDVPLLVELRDLWAGNAAFDRGGPVLRRLESWVVDGAAAVVAVTPEAAGDLRRRHAGARVEEISNGFEPELLVQREAPKPMDQPISVLHSGTLTVDRPLAPLLRVLEQEPYGSAFELVLHGYVAPEIRAELDDSAVDPLLVPPSDWKEAVARIAEADVCLITQARGAGDDTAVAAKVYEYLALGKPVLCISHGGATEGLLRRLGVDQLCARLDDERSIEAALDRVRGGDLPPQLPPDQLEPYERPKLAGQIAGLMDTVAA